MKQLSIEDSTVLMPEVIAGCVVQELERLVTVDLSPDRERLIGVLCDRAQWCWETNKRFRASMRRSSGRDELYMWMWHWLLSEFYGTLLFSEIPNSFKLGAP